MKEGTKKEQIRNIQAIEFIKDNLGKIIESSDGVERKIIGGRVYRIFDIEYIRVCYILQLMSPVHENIDHCPMLNQNLGKGLKARIFSCTFDSDVFK